MFKRNTIYREEMRRNLNLCLGGGWLWRSFVGHKTDNTVSDKTLYDRCKLWWHWYRQNATSHFCVKRNVRAEKHSSGVGVGQHGPEQREQHPLVDATTRCGGGDSQGRCFLWGSFWQWNQQQTPEQQAEESARGRSEGRAGAILSWLTKSVAEKRDPPWQLLEKKWYEKEGT